MIQHGQVFKLKTKGPDGQALWAYRYRLEGSRFGAVAGGRVRLRPSELFGLDKRDVDPQLGFMYVCRAYANGRIKHTKTRLSTRAVPLQTKALDALDRLPASANRILFPNMRGGRIDFRIFGRKHWRPAQLKAGMDSIRGLYDLRHTYATFALRAGVPVFAVSRFMGTSRAMIDRHYGHLANDSRDHAVALLVHSRSNARWTLRGRRSDRLECQSVDGIALAGTPATPSRGCSVDAAPGLCRLNRRLRSW